MLGTSFPVSDYYKESIITGRTLSRTGQWWSAILVIRDPKSGAHFLAAYKWQHLGGVWKVRSKWNIRSSLDAFRFSEAIAELKIHLSDNNSAEA